MNDSWTNKQLMIWRGTLPDLSAFVASRSGPTPNADTIYAYPTKMAGMYAWSRQQIEPTIVTALDLGTMVKVELVAPAKANPTTTAPRRAHPGKPGK